MKLKHISCRSSHGEVLSENGYSGKSLLPVNYLEEVHCFSEVAGPGLQSVARVTTKITFFTETFSKIVQPPELNS